MKRFVIPMAALLLLIFAVCAVIVWRDVLWPAVPINSPPESSYPQYVAGVGLVEANTENIAIGAPVAGIVTDLYVKVGDKVWAGARLFRIGARNQEANISVRKANLVVAQANLLAARVALVDLPDQASRYALLWVSQAGNRYNRGRKQFAAAEKAAARLEQAKANFDLAGVQLKSPKLWVSQARGRQIN